MGITKGDEFVKYIDVGSSDISVLSHEEIKEASDKSKTISSTYVKKEDFEKKILDK